MPDTHWLDFSGAPPLIVPQSLVSFWRGTTDPSTETYRAHDPSNPVTDYDRACLMAEPGRGLLDLCGSQVLALCTMADTHAWSSRLNILAGDSWWPSDDLLLRAEWEDPIYWHTEHSPLLLMNSAVDGSEGLHEDDFLVLSLSAGSYTVTTAFIEGKSFGYFHRFVRTTAASIGISAQA